MFTGDSNPEVDQRLAAAAGFQRNRWKYVAFQMSLFPHPAYPFDPVVVRRFREDIDPSMLPVWMRHVWRSPEGGLHYFDYHVLSFENPDWDKVGPESEQNPPHRDFRGVRQSTKGPSRRPHDYIEILYSKSRILARALSPDIIGAFWPLSMMHYHKYREITWANNQAIRKDQAEASNEAIKDRIRRVDAHYRAESDYRWDHDWNHLQSNAEGLSIEEQRQVATSGQLASRVGHILPSAP